MAFNTRRQHRYLALRTSGFLPFEARALSKVPIKSVPYVREMVTERQHMLKTATKQKTTPSQWESKIKTLYKVSDFLSKSKNGTLKYDVWKLFRDFEDRFKDRFPQYESPWKKRDRGWKDFLKKAENTIKAKQTKFGFNQGESNAQQE